jgi:3-methylfumaryl-CoA hydratase
MQGMTPEYTTWIGRTETTTELLAPAQAMAAAAMFDLDESIVGAGSVLPPLWQWLYFLGRAPQSSLASDGHPPRGGFLPPIPYPRRMFAGGRLQFHAPLTIGVPAEREGTIRNVVLKSGRSGSLAFVTVGYRYTQGGTLCIEEEQDVVYREPGAAVAEPVPIALPDPGPGVTTRRVAPDTRLLFRFSALTFNAHRIHYDREYARREEGYPGLVVHGPLIAMQLMALAREVTGAAVVEFEFRSERPVFDLAPYHLSARPDGEHVRLSAIGPDGEVAQRATARCAG